MSVAFINLIAVTTNDKSNHIFIIIVSNVAVCMSCFALSIVFYIIASVIVLSNRCCIIILHCLIFIVIMRVKHSLKGVVEFIISNRHTGSYGILYIKVKS